MILDNSYGDLGDLFAQRINPIPVKKPKLLLWNEELCSDLGWDFLENASQEELGGWFSGNLILPGSQPVATVYSGHQFGHFSGRLGDGRAHLLGGGPDKNGRYREIQLKGSGPTRFSRRGDGRCALGPAIREYVMGEAMHGLKIPTTRCIAVTTTGEQVYRQKREKGAIVARLTSSHIRVGSFQYFASENHKDALKTLANFTIARHFPEITEQGHNRWLSLLDHVIRTQVELVVHWMRVGFIHGVMNTDNTALSGETIDYGPCAMMNSYDPKTVFSSIDTYGRYSFGNQPGILQWNLARLAEAFIPLFELSQEKVVELLLPRIEAIEEQFSKAWLEMMIGKMGLSAVQEGDLSMVNTMLQDLEQEALDYTIFFQDLSQHLKQGRYQELIPEGKNSSWFQQWQGRLGSDPKDLQGQKKLMESYNPMVIPRNYQVEKLLVEVDESQDPQLVEKFVNVFRKPYEMGPDTSCYLAPPPDGDRGYQTFCGT